MREINIISNSISVNQFSKMVLLCLSLILMFMPIPVHCSNVVKIQNSKQFQVAWMHHTKCPFFHNSFSKEKWCSHFFWRRTIQMIRNIALYALKYLNVYFIIIKCKQVLAAGIVMLIARKIFCEHFLDNYNYLYVKSFFVIFSMFQFYIIL